MLVQNHYTDCLVPPPSFSLIGEAWTTEVVPRLPANLAEQARGLKAFQRVRGIAPPHDLLRGLLAYVLGPVSPRRRGAWAVLSGLADISEAAWRKRLRTRNDGLVWWLSTLVAVPATPLRAVPRPAGRLLLVDARCRHPPGGTGDDWRLPLAYDFLAGGMRPGRVTDRRGGERLDRYTWQPGDVIVAARGDGSRRSVAWAVPQQAAVVVRLQPATCPLATEGGQPGNVLRGLRQRGSSPREGVGGCRWQGPRYRVRLLAGTRAAQATQRARCRPRRTAQQAGRTLTAPPLAVAGWRWRRTTLPAELGSAAAGLALYRVRGQGARVLKKMQPRRRLHPLRSTHRTSVDAMVRALRMAWALPANTTAWLRTL